MLKEEKEFCTFDVATEVIQLHFMNKVGYVALIETMHEKFHNGFLNIPVSAVRGDYNWFLKEYSKYLDQEDLDTLNSRLIIKTSNTNWSSEDYPGLRAVGDE